MLITDKSGHGTQVRHRDILVLEKIALDSRVLIVEGISGSGKDTFQMYLKKKLQGRDLYDYSEGELLLSWNQLLIKGIFNLQVKLMKLFVSYVTDILNRDEDAVFLLNRFHLSAYVLAITKQPKLERDYDEVINALRRLPVHVFILRLDENEIATRSLHPERSSAWQKFQQQIVEREGFRDRLERYLWQQRLMLDRAEKQQIPYSVIKFPFSAEIGGGRVRVLETQTNLHHDVQINPADTKMSRRKRDLPQTL
jgi:thymidylate kinase